MVLYTAPGTGGLSFLTNPPGAELILNEESYGQTPIVINNVPPGPVPFVIKMQGYEDYSDIAEVVVTRLCCIDTDLMAAQAKKTCNPTPLETSSTIPIPTPSAPPDYKMLIIGIFAGIGIILLLEKIFEIMEKGKK